MKNNVLKYVVLFVVVAIFVVACGGQPTEAVEPADEIVSSSSVIAEGRLEPVQGTNLTFQARGVVEEVFVKAGDTVSQGDVLVQLSNAGIAEAQVVVAQNAYDLLLRNEGGDRADLWHSYMEAQIARADAEEKWEDLNVDSIEDRMEDLEADIEDLKEDRQDAQD